VHYGIIEEEMKLNFSSILLSDSLPNQLYTIKKGCKVNKKPDFEAWVSMAQIKIKY
jgi:hypothetical protein